MEKVTEQVDASHAEIHDYDPRWVEIYNEESQKIKDLLGGKILQIEHIGSTSIPGLASKPIIDMAIVAPTSEDANKIIEPLRNLGYLFDFDVHEKSGGTERHFLKKVIQHNFTFLFAMQTKEASWKGKFYLEII